MVILILNLIIQDKDYKFGQMVIIMKANLKINNLMEKESFNKKMEQKFMEIIKMQNYLDK